MGIDSINMDDNFFAIGGHSLLALRILFKVKDVFLLEIPLRYLFLEPTLKGFVKIIKSRLHTNISKTVERNYNRIAKNYRPEFCSRRIALIANEKDHSIMPYLGWMDLYSLNKKAKYAANEKKSNLFETYIVSGDHITRLTTYGKETGSKIRFLLDSVSTDNLDK